MPNWSLIATGATFQSLVNTLLLFDDATNRVFGRPGPDGGLDARSSNGETIWQAKFHQVPSIEQTLADARAELVTIAAAWETNPEIARFVRSALEQPNNERAFDYAAVVLERRLCACLRSVYCCTEFRQHRKESHFSPFGKRRAIFQSPCW